MNANQTTLCYVHDPMCSWCWAFRPTWEQIQGTLPEGIGVQRLLGGLAPDSDQPMPQEMQRYLQRTWRQIQERVPGTRFNFAFWSDCRPRRSTYPACRAVIAASRQDPANESAMILAIQEAYYLQARNPSDDDTLVALAAELGLDSERFGDDLDSPDTRAEFRRQIGLARALGVQGFPALVLVRDDGVQPLRLSYDDPEVVLRQLR
jgi:putative protein-disulfide isomerase